MKIIINSCAFLFLFIISCKSGDAPNQKEFYTPTELKPIGNVDSAFQSKSTTDSSSTKITRNWDAYQDSIRNVLLSFKKNNIIKNSILQEAYIRDVVSAKNDSIYFFIPFDLHDFNGRAPDCYSTDLSFKFKLTSNLEFPQELPYILHEHGCVKKTIKTSSVFKLKEVNNKYVTYYSESNKSTLVMFKNDERGQFIYYFSDVDSSKVDGNSVHKIISEYNENNPKSIIPYRSTKMSNSDYSDFLPR